MNIQSIDPDGIQIINALSYHMISASSSAFPSGSLSPTIDEDEETYEVRTILPQVVGLTCELEAIQPQS